MRFRLPLLLTVLLAGCAAPSTPASLSSAPTLGAQSVLTWQALRQGTVAATWSPCSTCCATAATP